MTSFIEGFTIYFTISVQVISTGQYVQPSGSGAVYPPGQAVYPPGQAPAYGPPPAGAYPPPPPAYSAEKAGQSGV